jgi:hypothetical protein
LTSSQPRSANAAPFEILAAGAAYAEQIFIEAQKVIADSVGRAQQLLVVDHDA